MTSPAAAAAAAAAASNGGNNGNGRGPASRQVLEDQQEQEPPPPPLPLHALPRERKPQEPPQGQQPISIESIAAALESGQSQTATSGSNGQQQQQVWRSSPASGGVGAGAPSAYQMRQGAGARRDVAPDRETGQSLDSRDFERAGGLGVGGRDPKAFAGIMGGGGTGGGKKANRNPNK